MDGGRTDERIASVGVIAITSTHNDRYTVNLDVTYSPWVSEHDRITLSRTAEVLRRLS